MVEASVLVTRLPVSSGMVAFKQIDLLQINKLNWLQITFASGYNSTGKCTCQLQFAGVIKVSIKASY